MEEPDKNNLSQRVGDLLRSALKSDRLEGSVRKSSPSDSLDLVEEMITAESEMRISLFSTLERTRAELEQVLGSKLSPQGGLVPFSVGAAKVLELAEKAAGEMGHEYTADAHVLLGLAVVNEEPCCSIVGGLNLNSKSLYDAVEKLDFRAQKSLKELMLTERTTAFEIILGARTVAANGKISTMHMLAAILQTPRSSAARILKQQGVDLERLGARVSSVLGSFKEDSAA